MDTDRMYIIFVSLILLAMLMIPTGFSAIEIESFECESTMNYMSNGWCFLQLNATTSSDDLDNLEVYLYGHRVNESGPIRIHYQYEDANNKYPWVTHADGAAEMQIFIDDSYIIGNEYTIKAKVLDLTGESQVTITDPRPPLDNLVTGLLFISGEIPSILILILGVFFLIILIVVLIKILWGIVRYIWWA